MDAEHRIRRVREVIARAAALLEAPRLDNAAELIGELQCAVEELERLDAKHMGSESRQLAAALTADLRLVTAMHENALRFYQGWGRIAAATAIAYTPSGTEPPPDSSGSVSLRG